MKNQNEDKFDKAFPAMLDASFDLAIQLSECVFADLTKEEQVFLHAFDDYMEALEGLDESESH